MDITVRKATLKDLNDIVKIHQSAFDGFFLTSLGSHFLKLYYSSFIESEDGVVFCALRKTDVAGFSACSFVSRGFNSSLIKKNMFRYGLEAIHLIFTKPKAVIRLIKNLNKEKSDAIIEDNGLYAELYSIAVDPSFQGGGVGRRLLMATEEEVKKHNNQISLTTDYYNNEKTIAFYRSLEYQDFYEFVTYPDRKMWRLIKQL